MKILCAPDSFKESLTAVEAAKAMARGIAAALPDAIVDLCPIADGGEGTVEALVTATHGELRVTEVLGPLGKPVKARWGLLGKTKNNLSEPLTAVIEMAEAAGLALVPKDQRDPTGTTTFGVGELMRQAMACGAKRLILGLGGSSTTDGGAGMAQALGARFIDRTGETVTEPMTGGRLPMLERVDLATLDPRLAWTEVIAACDVINPLIGLNGASAIYGPQKGATASQVALLDEGLNYLSELMGKKNVRQRGAGAAGGLAWGLLTFAGATLQPGIEMVLDAVGFNDRIENCDLCLTGEGKLDGQSLSGKACMGVANRAADYDVPTVALVGCVGRNVSRALGEGLAGYRVIGEGLSISTAESMARAAELLEKATVRFLKTGKRS